MTDAKEKQRLRKVAWRATPEGRAAGRVAAAKYRAANPEAGRARSAKYREANKEKRNAYTAAYRIKNKEALKAYTEAYHRERFTGLSAALVAKLRVLQGGKCAVCTVRLRTAVGEKRRPDGEQADHCHESNKPRGLLCRECNLSLGRYEAHQRPAGLVLQPYEDYLRYTPVMRLEELNGVG
jgi:hypothetical protein